MTSPYESSNDRRFIDYYKSISLNDETLERFQRIRELVVSLIGENVYSTKALTVADIGCGPGVQSIMWAKDGHRVHGIDVSHDLVEEGKKRASELGETIEFAIGSATDLPWEDEAFDVCLVPELLEHVDSWERCLDEFARVLKPGGVIFLSTTNVICPIQQEFELPLYSWYPKSVKRRCVERATTSNPEWVNYAKYPAVNWFTFYQLREELGRRGMVAYDRIDIRANHSGYKGRVAQLVSRFGLLRFLSQVATPYCMVLGVKARPST